MGFRFRPATSEGDLAPAALRIDPPDTTNHRIVPPQLGDLIARMTRRSLHFANAQNRRYIATRLRVAEPEEPCKGLASLISAGAGQDVCGCFWPIEATHSAGIRQRVILSK